MTKSEIIENSKKDSDLLLYRAFKIIPILLVINLIFIFVASNFKFSPIDYVTASNIIFVLIPIVYYKLSKEHKHYAVICLVCIEIVTAIYYLTSWVYASLLWVLSFAMANFYFSEKIQKRLLMIKIPLFIVASFLVIKTRPEMTITPSTDFAILSALYYTLQLYLINVLFRLNAEKSNKVFDICLAQTGALSNLVDSNINNSKKINHQINELTERLEVSASATESIAIQTSDISVKANNMAKTAIESKKATETVMSQLETLIDDSDSITVLINKMKKVTHLNKTSINQLAEKAATLGAESAKDLETTQQDLNNMFTLQENIIDKVKNMQQLIEKLSLHMNVLNDFSAQTLSESKETSDNISDISSSLQELTATFEEIASSAKMVQSFSNALIKDVAETQKK